MRPLAHAALVLALHAGCGSTSAAGRVEHRTHSAQRDIEDSSSPSRDIVRAEDHPRRVRDASDDRARDDQAIRRFVAAFARAWNAHDVMGLAELFAQDGTLVSPTGRIAHGRADIEKLITKEHAGELAGTSMVFHVEGIAFAAGDSAVVAGECRIDGMAQGSRFQVSVVVDRKTGKWSIGPCLFVALPDRPMQSAAPSED
jgi:uncharacterized protein (TIGR02246 family)